MGPCAPDWDNTGQIASNRDGQRHGRRMQFGRVSAVVLFGLSGVPRQELPIVWPDCGLRACPSGAHRTRLLRHDLLHAPANR